MSLQKSASVYNLLNSILQYCLWLAPHVMYVTFTHNLPFIYSKNIQEGVLISFLLEVVIQPRQYRIKALHK